MNSSFDFKLLTSLKMLALNAPHSPLLELIATIKTLLIFLFKLKDLSSEEPLKLFINSDSLLEYGLIAVMAS